LAPSHYVEEMGEFYVAYFFHCGSSAVSDHPAS